jgi:large subunit ribosomal protein L11
MVLLKLLVDGGKMSPGPAVAQQLGPMGINMGEVISQINKATSEFKGVIVPVHLTVDAKTKEFSIKVLSPPTSELIKKELGIEKASGARLKQRVGNLAIEQVISISKAKHESLLSNEFISTVKSVVGTCQALGVLIENKEAQEVQEEILEGKYSNEISSERTEVSPEKRFELDSYFKTIEEAQEAVKKAEDEEKAAEEEKKAEESVSSDEASEENNEEKK